MKGSATIRAPQPDVKGVEADVPSEWTIPRYFGPREAPRFGWVHLPSGPWSGVRVVICPPVGYEGLFAHPTLRLLAQRLCRETGAAVHRPDYFGTGDSAGSDESPDLVERWIETIQMAVDDLRATAPSEGPVVLVGMRVGAFLATEAARRIGGVDGMVLWAPPPSGKAFVREQRAMAATAHATYSELADDGASWGEDGFEAAGYVFTSDTVDALKAFGTTARTCPSGRVLVVERDDMPGAAQRYTSWASSEVAIDTMTGAGYPGLMQPPISLELPHRTVDSIVRWVEALAPSRKEAPCERPRERRRAMVTPVVEESAIWYDGREGSRFGILTEPIHRPRRALLMLNNAHGNRTGPAGMYTWCARRLAEAGVASMFRIDLAGIGDSEDQPGRPEHHSYGLDAIADVTAAVAFLKDRGYDEVYAGGLCSGAYLAWHAALEGQQTDGLVLINQQTFSWSEGDGLDVDPLATQYESDHYKQSARSLKKWAKLLRGQVDLRYVASTMFDWLRLRVDATVLRVKARLPFALRPTPVVEKLQDVLDRGVNVHFVFSGRDPGVTHMDRVVGAHLRTLRKRWGMDVRVIDGPDHSFTSRSSRRALGTQLVEILTNPVPDDRR